MTFQEIWQYFVLYYNRMEANLWKRFALDLQVFTFNLMRFKSLHKKSVSTLIGFLYLLYVAGIVIYLLDRSSYECNARFICVFCTSLSAATNGLLLIIGPKIQPMQSLVPRILTFHLQISVHTRNYSSDPRIYC